MKLVCTNNHYQHPYVLGVARLDSGVVEIKCPRCSQICRFGDGLAPTEEVRCPVIHPNGWWCGRLAMIVSRDLTGTINYSCPKCSTPRTLKIDTPAIVPG